MNRTRTAPRVARVLLIPVAALALAGCGSIQEAVDGAQGAVDAAQSVLQAPQQIGAACESAVAALAPGLPAAEARAALDESTALLDAALGGAASLPGISDVRDAFVSAAESLTSGVDSASTEAARSAVSTACAAFTGQ
jgi:uncharacterized protein YceK